MRATIRDLLLSDPTLTAFIPTERWYQQGAVEDVPVKPFAVLQWLAPVSTLSRGTFAKQLMVKVYDLRGSYSRIDPALKTVFTLLDGIEGLTGVDGYVAEATFVGDSGDQEDIDYKANMKYSSWQIIGRSF